MLFFKSLLNLYLTISAKYQYIEQYIYNFDNQLCSYCIHAIRKLLYIWGVSRQMPQRAARKPKIVLFLTHVYDTKMYLKKLFDKRFRRIFPQLSNDVGSFSEIFHFDLQKLFRILYLAENISGTLRKISFPT